MSGFFSSRPRCSYPLSATVQAKDAENRPENEVLRKEIQTLQTEEAPEEDIIELQGASIAFDVIGTDLIVPQSSLRRSAMLTRLFKTPLTKLRTPHHSPQVKMLGTPRISLDQLGQLVQTSVFKLRWALQVRRKGTKFINRFWSVFIKILGDGDLPIIQRTVKNLAIRLGMNWELPW